MRAATNGNGSFQDRVSRALGLALPFLLAAIVMIASGHAIAGAVHPDLEARLAASRPGALVPVIVELVEQENAPAVAARAQTRNRHARAQAVVGALRDIAARTQQPILAQLAQEQASGHAHGVASLWIINGVALSATEPAIRRLAARADVREVRLDATIPPPPRPQPTATLKTASADIAWNIERIRAPEVWGAGYDGTGTVVGSFDTGVDVTHPDLAPRYRGNDAISWFDPYGEHASPFDANGHGTHTTGTAVGGDASGVAIGVAPGAKWIAAKAWDDNDNATVSAFHQIFQWFLAPGGDPANAPDVVNDSWGLDPPACYPDFLPDVQALRAAGIFPVFAAGNDGPGTASILSPGNYNESFAVGATDDLDEIADFSSRGPSQCDGAIKPDISAPGVAIYSSLPGDFWFELDGTSMATPHVTGAVAVLRSISPTITPDDLEAALVQGAVDLGTPGADNDYGIGRLDLLKSAQIVVGKPLLGIAATTPTATEAGTVPGAFTVTREGDTSAALNVTYTVTGTATPGADYVALPGSVTIPAGAASATIVVTPIDDTLIEYDETVVVKLDPNPAYLVAPSQATVTIVSDELFPDLAIPNLVVPTNAGAGTTISVSDTTKNQGGGAAPATTTRYYLSADSALDGSDAALGSRAVPALAPGASDTGTVSLTLPAALSTGTYFLIARADSADAVPETSETNNTQLRAILIGPDLTISAMTVPATAGAGATISVTDTAKNQGGGAAPATTTRYYLSADSALDATDVALGSRAVAALAAGASDTGTVSLTIPAGTVGGVYYFIAKVDGDDTLLETQESNNTSLRVISIGADLAISAMTVPATAGAGATISVTETTKNQGAGDAPATTTRYYLSADSALDGSDVVLGARSVAALAAGASDTGTVSLTIPAATATGAYFLIARADATDLVPETSETNNTLLRSILVGPDLTISAMTVPASAGAGATITVSDTTLNQGGGATPATTTRYYLSANSQLDATDVALGSRAVAALAPGASDSGSVSLTIPAGTVGGVYYLIAEADGDHVVGETQEGNNTSLRVLSIGADLVVASLTAPANAGATITVTDTTKNQGGGAAPATTTRYYLSADSALDGSDVVLGSRAVAALAAGASDTGTVTLTIPATTATGTYFLIARADATDVVPETSETNNTLLRAILVGPDLTISAMTVPASAGAGATISVSDTTKNQGGGDAPATTTRYYLSADSALDGTDTALGARSVAALAAGASDSGAVSLTIPAGIAGGVYYLIAKADGDDTLAETQEGNNTSLRVISIGADLTISAMTVPATAGAGATITVSDTTRNQGGGAAPATTTRYYLSADSALDGSDVALGSRAVAALAPGASDSGSVSLAIPPATAAGAYFLIARADATDLVPETSETNNTLLRSILVGPDLAISAMTVPATAGAGAAISVTDTTKNQGGGAAPATTTRYYLSADSALDGTDIALGARSVAALAAGASDTGSVSLTIPSGTAGGVYYLIAEADGDHVVGETQEGNNTSLRVLSIGADLVVASLTAPASASATITVSDTTKNQGGGAAPATTTRYYLSADSALDGSDVVLGARSVAALAPGASDTGSVTLTIPATTATGTYFLIARADATDVVPETSETNNTLLRAILVGPDLTISAMTAPTTAGAGATISVSDTTKNQGGGAAPATTTRYYLSADSALDGTDTALGARSVAALAAGASDSGTVSLTIPAGTLGGVYYLIAKADGDDALAETQESNNTSLRVISIGPDLVVASLVAPASASATISVTDTTRNQGGGAAPATTTRYYLSADSALDGSDVVLGSRAVAALAPGASDTGSVSLAIPPTTATGTYFLIARADATDLVTETSEANNTLLRSILVGPDLTISAMTVPATAGAGATISVSDTTLNQGGGAAPATTTRYYLSANSALDGTDIALGARSVAALAAGASDTGTASLTIPAGTAGGVYYLIAKADGDDALVETQESNNTTLRVISIGADLVVASLNVPASAGAGATITVSDTTLNQGGGAAPATTTRYYLSANSALDAGDVALGGRAVAALAPGASDTGTVSLTIPAGTAGGVYYLIARVDGDDTVAETQEGNNTSLRVISIGPDLVVASLSAPASAGAGTTISASDTTKNQGAGDAPATTTRYYLSTDTALDGADVALGARSVAALAAGASDTGTVSLTIPAGTAGGTYYLLADSDGDHAVGETQEGNNRLLRVLQVSP